MLLVQLAMLWCCVCGAVLCAGSLGSLILKLGPKYDMGPLCPKKDKGWQQVAKGKNFCVWLKPNDGAVSSADE